MTVLTHGISWIDLEFMGRRHAIATGVVRGGGSLVLVDPGPASCLDALEAGLQGIGARLSDVDFLLLTHIHLDHAGATGTIVRMHPHIRVFVHDRGAPHMADPSKLLASASRLYGDRMDRLWGAVEPVPQDRLIVVQGGERVEAGGRTFDVAYTPGHASHHVSYFDGSSGIAFVGDTAGVCIDGGYVLPPTPPPDVDIEAWGASVERIGAWAPSTLFLTHFGPIMDVRPHLQTLMEHLHVTAQMVRRTLTLEGADEERSARFAEDLRREMRQTMTDAQIASYPVAAPFEQLWLGLARYWRKRDAAAAP